VSLELIAATGVGEDARILDVGGGASLLVDRLLEAGFGRVGVLDISGTALRLARERLGRVAERVDWIEEDLLGYSSAASWDVWHDRAVFHFLVDPLDRERYRGAVRGSVARDGHVIVATFSPSGPERCSGLPTLRCSAGEIAVELGDDFELVEERLEDHTTPAGAVQPFVYARLRRVPP